MTQKTDSATRAPSQGCAPARALISQLEREQFNDHEASGACADAYAVARDQGYRRGWNDSHASVIRGLRELRSALCVETVRVPVLFEAVHVEGEWEP